MADHRAHTLITHSGSFHANDLLAYAVLSVLYPEARLVRTRDAQLIEGVDGTAIVFDVGFLYAPESNRYDHHQPDRPRRPEGLAYSSFGLIWRHFGRAHIAATLGLDETTAGETVEQIHAELDAGLVRDIDAVDNSELAAGQDALMHPLSRCPTSSPRSALASTKTSPAATTRPSGRQPLSRSASWAPKSRALWPPSGPAAL